MDLAEATRLYQAAQHTLIGMNNSDYPDGDQLIDLEWAVNDAYEAMHAAWVAHVSKGL